MSLRGADGLRQRRRERDGHVLPAIERAEADLPRGEQPVEQGEDGGLAG